MDRAEAIVAARCLRYHDLLTIAYLDCDNFKPLNDQCGHKVGDQALCVLVQTVQANLRQSDRIARVGGDEFVLLLTRVSFDSAQQVFEKLRDKVNQVMKEHAWPVTLSMGAVTYDKPESNAKAMLEAADQLMYESKRSGKNRIRHIHNRVA